MIKLMIILTERKKEETNSIKEDKEKEEIMIINLKIINLQENLKVKDLEKLLE